MTETLIAEIQAYYRRLRQAAADARYWYEHYVDDLRTGYPQRLAEIEATFAAQRGQEEKRRRAPAEAATTQGQSDRQTQEQVAAVRSAFWWVVSPWEDLAWDGYEPVSRDPIPPVVRAGRLTPPADLDLGDFPALVPLIGQGSIFLTGIESAATRGLLQALILRLVVSFPPGTLRLALVDPVGLGSNLTAFLRLPETLRGEKVCSRPEDIERLLDNLVTHIETVNQTRLLNLYATIEDYNAQAGEISVPYYVLALVDFPAGFSERAAEHLVHIARNGPRAGVYIVASLNDGYEAPRKFERNELVSLGTSLNLTAIDRLEGEDPDLGRFSIVPDVLPAAERVNQWLEAVGTVAAQAPVSLPFGRIAVPEAERWTGSSRDGLSVPIGVSSTGEVQFFTLGQGMIHHGLIGGITQSGKTNLLHVLITQLAMRYPPEELELYLVDFKEGVEFADYLGYALPHVRVVALESEREFGLSVLRRLQEEMEARGRLFKQIGIARLPDYRRQTGQRLPRILAILDEFQVLFSEDDRLAQEASRLLEDLSRRGAAFGLHLLLSSQSPSGGPAYGRHIYDQMALRIALQCRPADAQAILGEGNDAAGRLERAGEVIYNDDMGHREKNVFARIAFLPVQERRQYLAAACALAVGKDYPGAVTFEGRSPALLEFNGDLRASLAQPGWSERQSPVPIWLGQPIEIKPLTTAILERYARSNLLIGGGDEEAAYGLLVTSLLSLAAQRAPADASFFITDFARPESPFASLLARFKAALPHLVELAGPREAGAVLARLVSLATQRATGEAPAAPDCYLLIAGLQRWRDLRGSDPYVQSEAARQLSRLAEEGPEVGIHLVVWADGFATLERVLKRGGVGYFDLRVALRMPEKDSNDLLGSNAAARLEDNRALFRHEEWELGRLEKFKPYAAPGTEVMEELLKVICAKSARLGGPDERVL
jgi:hypothetical protein